MRCETTGQKSESGATSASSVQTAAQPPSALVERKRACEAGFSLPKPGAVGHLVEAVPQRLRADLHRLEEDVVAGIARHGPG